MSKSFGETADATKAIETRRANILDTDWRLEGDESGYPHRKMTTCSSRWRELQFVKLTGPRTSDTKLILTILRVEIRKKKKKTGSPRLTAVIMCHDNIFSPCVLLFNRDGMGA